VANTQGDIADDWGGGSICHRDGIVFVGGRRKSVIGDK
jgi:hypothetical protein